MHRHHLALTYAQITDDEAPQIVGHSRVHPKTNNAAAPAPFQGCLEEANQIFGLLFYFDITVPYHSEQTPTFR